MQNKLKLTALTILTSVQLMAQPLEHLNTEIHSESLNTYLQNNQDGWFAYRIDAAPDTVSMCCYNHGNKTACDLNQKRYGYGSSSNSSNTDHINIFVQLQNGEAKTIMPVGDSCKIKADGLVIDWVTDVPERTSIDFLQQDILKSQDGDENGALYTLALHPDSLAAETLVDLADDEVGEYSEQAVFWLGQRHHDGFDYLAKLYDNLPAGKVRRKLNFALSQNKTPESVELLKTIAQSDQDSEQQADAIFWLSQTDKVTDLPEFLIHLMNTTKSYKVQEKAIFSLSQIKSPEANEELARLVKDHKDIKIREKSLFWLVQNSPEQARSVAIELLKSSNRDSEQKNAVFVLSQLPNKQSSLALFSLIRGDYNRKIKKEALFWLSQSDDAEVIAQLEGLL